MTGLAAGWASGLPVYEAAETPGGICSSYYVRPGEANRLHDAPPDGGAYRFELGGGHWIFGGQPVVLALIRSLVPVRSYARRSSVYFPNSRLAVPYPVQNHLRYLGPDVAGRAVSEIRSVAVSRPPFKTMAEWLRASFGPTLCDLFFDPFHELYTAGLWQDVAPQDAYKSPVDVDQVLRGASDDPVPVGYNVRFVYPEPGLNVLARRLAERADVRYGKKVSGIDLNGREILFSDGTSACYHTLISTLPLNRMMELTGLIVDAEPDPSTSVLVINCGAIRGPRCPSDHWVYVPRSDAGFHRVGFYSNVDRSFLPRLTVRPERVSVYVEMAFRDGHQPAPADVARISKEVVHELQQWEWIEDAEVVDPTWIDVAYTWSRPSSRWVRDALSALEVHSVYPVGRYARWVFQGIADSIGDGLKAGAAFRCIGK